MLKDFRDFIIRGNVIDLAVAFIIGVAFAAVVTSLVNDLIMPPIGLLLGGVDFRDLFVVLQEGAVGGPYPTLQAAGDAGAVTLRYGSFINTLVTFLIIAFAVFLLVRAVKGVMERPAFPTEKANAATQECPFCASIIPLKATRCPHCTSAIHEIAR